MPVIYDGKKLIPAPLVTIGKSYRRAGDSRKISPIYNISVKGKIIPYKGSPIVATGTTNEALFDSGGTFDYPADGALSVNDRQNAIRVKQEAIRDLFSRDGRWFEITPWNDQPGMKCQPRVKDISFPEGTWVETCDYTIELETDRLICGIPSLAPYEDANDGDPISADKNDGSDIPKDYYVQNVNESWTMDFDTEVYGIFRIQHTVSAVGLRTWEDSENPTVINKEAWENAKEWVESRLGYNPMLAMSGTINIDTNVYAAYNHVRNQNINYFNGEYSVTESWVLSTGNFYETFSVESRKSQQDGLTTVSIQGVITGLDSTDIDSVEFPASHLKYANANIAWSGIKPFLITRAQNYSGLKLNVNTVNEVVGRNPFAGTITYNYEYNNRPSNCLGSGVLSESITITDDNPYGDVDEVAQILVLNRFQGPVLQGLGTTRATKRSVVIEAVVGLTGTCMENLVAPTSVRANVIAVLTNLIPNYESPYIFVSNDQETWSPSTGRYTRSYEWTYERG